MRLIGLVLTALVLAACATTAKDGPDVSRARVYPAMGQFPDQQERDSHQCAAWAHGENVKASGFGGTMEVIGGAVTGAGTQRYGWNQAGADRAYAVCMNGRGYSVIFN